MADIKDLMARVIDDLYAGLTGGDAEIPLPANTLINWIQPGIPLHPSEFDFAVAGPYAGPTPLTMGFFRELASVIQGDDPKMSREEVLKQAKLAYQQHLLGTWENWSRLVDFIPLPAPGEGQSGWTSRNKQGRNKHTQVVYAQSGRAVSQVYADALNLCMVADDEISDEKKEIITRMRRLLQEEVTVEDWISGEKRIEIRQSQIMKAYDEYQTRYENAVIDYGQRLARSQNGSAADLVEWSRSGGIYRARAIKAWRDWESLGSKNDVERAQAVLDQLLGTSAVQWVADLRSDVEQARNATQGVFGYPFFPASVVPGGFARSDSWTTYENHELHRSSQESSISRRGSASLGFSLGLVNFTGGGGGGRREEEFKIQDNRFGMKFQYTQVEVVRPAFNPGFFSSQSWKLKHEFTDAYRTDQLSDGSEKPTGALIAYPSKALFVRDLTFYSSDLASYMKTKTEDIQAGAFVGIGPILLGGGYQQSSFNRESNLEITDASVRIPGLQLVAFVSTLLPAAPNPSPDIKNWL